MSKIITIGENNQLLRQVSRPVKTVDHKLIQLMKEMSETLRQQQDPEGVGLSAIQIGYPIRLFAVNHTLLDAKKDSDIIFYLNPEIISRSENTTLGENIIKNKNRRLPGTRDLTPFLEGCLSVPDIYAPVPRREWIKAKTLTIPNAQISQLSKNFAIGHYPLTINHYAFLPARVFQHEVDHLNGVLFTDRALKAGSPMYRFTDKKMVPLEL